MRYTYILIALLIGVFAVACSTSAEQEKGFETKKIGTWEIVEEDSAVWIGESSANKMKADTLFITEPGEYGLNLWNIETGFEGSAKMGMYDTTFSYTGDLSDINFTTTLLNAEYGVLSMGGGKKSFGPSGVILEIGVNYNCGESITGEEILDYKIAAGDSVIKHYRFMVYGFVETVDELSC